MNRALAEIDRLRDEIYYLEAENANLKDMLTGKNLFSNCGDLRLFFDLTLTEGRLLSILVAGRIKSKSAIHELLYFERVNPPDIKIIDIYLCKLRKKLRPYSITISTLWGEGYFFSKDMIAKIFAHLKNDKNVNDYLWNKGDNK